MVDPVNIEALQAAKAGDAQDAMDEQAIRRLCTLLPIALPDPQPDDPAYRQLIVRLQEVIARDLQQEEQAHG